MIPCLIVRTRVIALILFVFICITSCKKDTESVGAAFVSKRNTFNSLFDTTILLNTYSVKMDSIISSKLTSYAFGAINDPYLGISKASIITQYGVPGNEFTWGDATKVDSSFLQLRFRNAIQKDGTYLLDYFGNKDAIHSVKVYLLTETISKDSSYYSTRKYTTDGIEMGSFTGKFNFTDSVTVNLGIEKLVIPPHVRIKMNSTFNTFLFNGEADGSFLTDAKFKEKYKGFVIVDETSIAPGEGAIVYVKLTSDVTALTAFYKDSLAADFPIVGGTRAVEASYNYYEHTNVPTNILQTGFNQQHRDTGFVQPLTGAKLRVELPNLSTFFSNPKTVINGAEIIFTPLAVTVNNFFTLPASMSLLGSDSLGKNVFLKDQFFESTAYYGGQLSNNQYKFNIVRHLQYLLDEKKKGRDYNYGMNLIIRADDPLTAQRTVLDTRKNSGTLKLKLTYTVIN